MRFFGRRQAGSAVALKDIYLVRKFIINKYILT